MRILYTLCFPTLAWSLNLRHSNMPDAILQVFSARGAGNPPQAPISDRGMEFITSATLGFVLAFVAFGFGLFCVFFCLMVRIADLWKCLKACFLGVVEFTRAVCWVFSLIRQSYSPGAAPGLSRSGSSSVRVMRFGRLRSRFRVRRVPRTGQDPELALSHI